MLLVFDQLLPFAVVEGWYIMTLTDSHRLCEFVLVIAIGVAEAAAARAAAKTGSGNATFLPIGQLVLRRTNRALTPSPKQSRVVPRLSRIPFQLQVGSCFMASEGVPK